jgi:hypothetical protein
MFDAQSHYSDLARSGPPLFFPDPPAPVTFNFDQGIASEETFPIDQLRRVLDDVLDRDEGRALEYISFGYDRDADSIVYLPTYIELVLGHTGLRQQVALGPGHCPGCRRIRQSRGRRARRVGFVPVRHAVHGYAGSARAPGRDRRRRPDP